MKDLGQGRSRLTICFIAFQSNSHNNKKAEQKLATTKMVDVQQQSKKYQFLRSLADVI